MKKVFQTIMAGSNANCMQAAMASLFDDELDKAPNFVSFGNKWWWVFKIYLKDKGYTIDEISLCNASYYGKYLDKEYSFDRLQNLVGIDNLFYASVSSPKYNPNGDLDGHTHAVIIDKNFNIVHDPNLEYRDIKYPKSDEGYNGIRQIFIFEKQKN